MARALHDSSDDPKSARRIRAELGEAGPIFGSVEGEPLNGRSFAAVAEAVITQANQVREVSDGQLQQCQGAHQSRHGRVLL